MALSLPDESDIRYKEVSEIKIQDLNEQNGMCKLYEYFDKWYKKDELSGAYEGWRKFIKYEKTSDESMEKYINEFDKRAKVLNKFKIEIPKSILAFILLDNASLDINQKQIVLTAVSFEKPDEMFENMKAALTKFFGSQEAVFLSQKLENTSISKSEGAVTVKTENAESALVTEEANITERGRPRWYDRGNRYRGRIRGRGDWRNPERSEYTRKCYVCGSVMHIASTCPHNVYLNQSEKEKENKSDKDKEAYCMDVLSNTSAGNTLLESFNYGVLDSACSSTVCGIDWYKTFLDSMEPVQLSSVEEEESDTKFRFGDGVIYPSIKRAYLPISIVGLKRRILVDVVECGIPLLISKNTLSRCDAIINFKTDMAQILGRGVKLQKTSTGHYKIPLLEISKVNIEDVAFTIAGNEQEKIAKIKKIHQQFGHPSYERLRKLMINADIKDKECLKYAEEISNQCDECVKFKRTPPRPIVSFNLGREFNETVAIDLKEWKKGEIYLLHMVDMATRFSNTGIIKSKDPKVVVEKILEIWIGSGLGVPLKFFCDNGGEFAYSVFLDMCENLNIQVIHTAAESPFSNGLCERNHCVIDEMIAKMMSEDSKMKLSTAVAWAVNAKNSLQMVGGIQSLPAGIWTKSKASMRHE